MGVITLEGIIEQGQIKLKTDMRIPDRTKVYVVIPNIQIESGGYIYSPRLVHPEEIVDFEMQVIKEPTP